MRDGVCLRASQGAKEETPPSRSLQSSEGLTASDKSRRSLPLFPPCATCGGWRALIFHPERERKPRGVKSDGGQRKREEMVRAYKNSPQMSFELRVSVFAVLYLSAIFLCRKQGRAATVFFSVLFARYVCVKLIVFLPSGARSLCSVTFNTVSYLEQKSHTEVIILLNKFRCWMRLFAPAVLWS